MAKTGTERTLAWRHALKEQGYKQKTFFLSPAALRGLAADAKKHGSENAAVEAAFAKKERANG